MTKTDLAGSRARFLAIGADLKKAFIERDHVVDGLLLAAIAGEHVLLLGPPGTGKSDLATSFANALGSRSFSYLVGAYTSPDEILGGFSLKKLAEEDVMQRKTTGRLPEAEVAFLDELFKANSKMLNTLLPVFNERVLYDADDKGNVVAKKLPLRIAITASNELPEDGDETLAAFDDRLLVRFMVERVSSDDAMRDLLFGTRHAVTSRATLEDLDTLREAAHALEWTSSAQTAFVDIRAAAYQDGLKVSDRKWRQAAKLCRASAVVAGRKHVNDIDLRVLEHALWRRPDERAKATALVEKYAAAWISLVKDTMATIREMHGKLAGIKSKKQSRADVMTQLAGLLRLIDSTLTPAIDRLKEQAPAEEIVTVTEAVKKLSKELDAACG